MTIVHTARISYAGPDKLNVTRGTAARARWDQRVSDGEPFAPSAGLLSRYLAARRGGPAAVEDLWPEYVRRYTEEMRVSYRDRRPAWDALLARPEVTLVCFCADPARCHRTVLAEILGKLGADVRGERGP